MYNNPFVLSLSHYYYSRLTTGAYTPPTRLNSTVESRRRRRCVLLQSCKLGLDSQIFVGSRRELVANSIHTADADATPTRLNSIVESRRRCVLGIKYTKFVDGWGSVHLFFLRHRSSQVMPITRRRDSTVELSRVGVASASAVCIGHKI